MPEQTVVHLECDVPRELYDQVASRAAELGLGVDEFVRLGLEAAVRLPLFLRQSVIPEGPMERGLRWDEAVRPSTPRGRGRAHTDASARRA
jgi:hypothetical protein